MRFKHEDIATKPEGQKTSPAAAPLPAEKEAAAPEVVPPLKPIIPPEVNPETQLKPIVKEEQGSGTAGQSAYKLGDYYILIDDKRSVSVRPISDGEIPGATKFQEGNLVELEFGNTRLNIGITQEKAQVTEAAKEEAATENTGLASEEQAAALEGEGAA